MQLLALAVGPAFLVLHVFYALDRRREPWPNLLKYCVAGGLSVFLAALLEDLGLGGLRALAPQWSEHSLGGLAFTAFVLVALVEEACKLAPVVFFGAFDRHIDEPFDWIVYSVASALGFAAVENLYYVADGGVGTALARALTAVPSHALDGTLMGYHLALASIATQPGERLRRRALALVEPMLWHGAYDALLLVSEERAGRDAATGSWSAAWFVLVGLQWIVAARRLASARALAPRKTPPLFYPLSATRYVRRRRG